MGLTTTIYFRIIKKLEDDKNNKNTDVILLYRNKPPKLKCIHHKKCKNYASIIYEETLLCNGCKNYVDEPEYLQNLLNSPRTGICGYGNKSNDNHDEFNESDESYDDEFDDNIIKEMLKDKKIHKLFKV